MADEPRGLDSLVERFTFANAAARTAAGPYFNQDIGKLAWQQDTQELWRLTAISPLTWSLISVGIDAGANPTGVVGLIAVNGVAATFLRSDSAPPIDQTIAPTWTGLHVFNSHALCVGTPTDSGAGIINVLTGFRIGNAATAGNVLRGNATNFVSAQLGRSDLSGTPAKVTHLTSGTTYTVTAGAKAMFVEGVGGGGGGGGTTGITSVYGGGAGGGGGGYAAVYIASPAASYSYAIGGGGSAGAAANGAGGTGGNTTFGAILTAGGGTGGAGSTVPTAGSSSIVGGGNAGAGSVGDFQINGNGGGAAIMVSTSASASTMALSGFGGGSFFGGGPRGLASNSDAQQNGTTGTNYGSGANGGLSKSTSGFTGGVGAAGAIRVTEYF